MRYTIKGVVSDESTGGSPCPSRTVEQRNNDKELLSTFVQYTRVSSCI